MDRFHSDLMPAIPFHVGAKQMGDLFANFYMAWATLGPVLALLFGIILVFGLLHMFKDEADSDKTVQAGIRRAVEKLSRKR